jgi:hypothetical protein
VGKKRKFERSKEDEGSVWMGSRDGMGEEK